MALTDSSPSTSFYLCGYVVECALKAVIEKAGLHAPAFGHQLAKLEGDGFDLAIAMAPGFSRYRPPASEVQWLRARWSEDRRYETTGDTALAQARDGVDKAAEVYEACIIGMFLDGLLSEVPR